MSRRFGLIATIALTGIVCAVALAIATEACGGYLSAVWSWHHARGPAVPISIACTPSLLAETYALELLWVAWPTAVAAAAVALLSWIAKVFAGAARTERPRIMIGWLNIGALTFVTVACVAIAGCNNGEVQFYSVPPAFIGFVSSALGSFTGVPSVRPTIGPGSLQG